MPMILRACAVTVASHRLMYAELDADGAATLAAALEQNTTLTCLEYGECCLCPVMDAITVSNQTICI